MIYTTQKDLTRDPDTDGYLTSPPQWLTAILEENGQTLVVAYPKEDTT